MSSWTTDRLKQRGARLVIALVMAATCVGLGIKGLRPIRVRWGDWPQAKATVTAHSKIIEDHQRHRSGSATITYEYTAGGSLRVGKHEVNERIAKTEDFLAEHPVGSEMPCWYDPDAPEKSVLSRDIGVGTFGYLTGALLAAFATVIMLWMTFRPFAADEEEDEDTSSDAGAGPGASDKADHGDDEA